jgi:hypothetical protein
MKNKNDMKLIMERWNRFSIQEEKQPSAPSSLSSEIVAELDALLQEQKQSTEIDEGIGDFLRGARAKFGKVGQAAALTTALASAFAAPGQAQAAEPTTSGVQTTQVQQQTPQTAQVSKERAQGFLGLLEDYIKEHGPTERMNISLKLAPLQQALYDIAHGKSAPIPEEFGEFLSAVGRHFDAAPQAQQASWTQHGANLQISSVGF